MTIGLQQQRVAFLMSLAVVVCVRTVSADLLVLDASAQAPYNQGRLIPTGARLVVPAGTILRTVDETGHTIIIQGPFDGVPQPATAAYLSAARLKELYDKLITHGILGLAITRSVDTPSVPDPWTIALTTGGAKCVLKDTPVTLWQPAVPEPRSVLLSVPALGVRVRFVWPSNTAVVMWPETVQLSDGGDYFAESYLTAPPFSGSTAAFTIRMIPQSIAQSSLFDVADVLIDHACFNQVTSLISTQPISRRLGPDRAPADAR